MEHCESFVYKMYVKFPVTSAFSKIKQSEIIQLNKTKSSIACIICIFYCEHVMTSERKAKLTLYLKD